jgi:hypothetical protein
MGPGEDHLAGFAGGGDGFLVVGEGVADSEGVEVGGHAVAPDALFAGRRED